MIIHDYPDSAGREDFPALPERLRDSYIIESRMSCNGDRAVYRLRSVALSDDIHRATLKVSNGASNRLASEYQALKRLDCPFIPKAIAFFVESGETFLLREYMEGVSLYDEVDSRGPLTADSAIRAMLAICGMLITMHRMDPPIIVNDLKPQHIIRRPGGYALIDLDASESLDIDSAPAITPSTAAPEQFGYGPIGPASDVYGAGMILLYLLTGDFKTDAAHQRLAPIRLRGILKRCLAFDPRQRYGSAEELSRALRRRTSKAVISRGIVSAAAVIALACGVVAYGIIDRAKTISFREPLIESAVRLVLGDGAALTKETLSAVETITICGGHVVKYWEDHDQYAGWHFVRESGDETMVDAPGQPLSLDDLRHLPNLNTLIIDYHAITDLTPLKGLPLRRISLCANNITDITALADIISIDTLRLEDNGIKSLAPLVGLYALRDLDISANAVVSLDPIMSLPVERLVALNINIDPAADFSGMIRLRELIATSLPEASLVSLASARSLMRLNIFSGYYTSFAPFAAITTLRALSIGDATVVDLTTATQMKGVTALSFSHLTADDLLWLSPMTQLESLGMEFVRVADMSALNEMPGLRDVYVDSRTAEQIRIDAPGMGARINVSRYTQ